MVRSGNWEERWGKRVGALMARLPATPAERQALEAALDRHCTCGYPRCAVHEMLLHREQRALHGLLFVRRVLRPRLLAGEFSSGSPGLDPAPGS